MHLRTPDPSDEKFTFIQKMKNFKLAASCRCGMARNKWLRRIRLFWTAEADNMMAL
jgi:hypothetical protein